MAHDDQDNRSRPAKKSSIDSRDVVRGGDRLHVDDRRISDAPDLIALDASTEESDSSSGSGAGTGSGTGSDSDSGTDSTGRDRDESQESLSSGEFSYESGSERSSRGDDNDDRRSYGSSRTPSRGNDDAREKPSL